MTAIVGSVETIKPWQYIRIQNISTPIEGVVNQITYQRDFVDITLNKIDNFINLIKE